jgi:hypothetical protein
MDFIVPKGTVSSANKIPRLRKPIDTTLAEGISADRGMFVQYQIKSLIFQSMDCKFYRIRGEGLTDHGADHECTMGEPESCITLIRLAVGMRDPQGSQSAPWGLETPEWTVEEVYDGASSH